LAISNPAVDSPRSGAKFRGCSDCPEMIVIPSGTFTMTRKKARDGRRDDDPEGWPKTKPAREVTIEHSFALGIYPVTRHEFEIYTRNAGRTFEKGCGVQMEGVWILDETKDWDHPGFSQTPRDPVTCVNWSDAQDYVRWLNAQLDKSAQAALTKGSYRLPTWEEIEYAAGAGITSPYYWGERAEHDRANYGADECLPCRPRRDGADRWFYTSPVGSFPPNAWGLYDMAGNVWQWAQSCRPDPNATPPKTCRTQILHGGSWLTSPENLMTGAYSTAVSGFRSNHIGFRVAMTLNQDSQ
jgi:formylglycine-generating enzyme required for sulfatase activity